jgi:hypothetical protein
MGTFMRIKMGLLAVVSVGALSQGFAMDPPAAPASSATTSTATTTSNTETPATTSSTTEPASAAKSATSAKGTGNATQVNLVAGDADAEAKLKQLKAAGYRPEMKNGQVIFCRKEQQLGSRFDKKACDTAENLERQMKAGQDLTAKRQHGGATTLSGR